MNSEVFNPIISNVPYAPPLVSVFRLHRKSGVPVVIVPVKRHGYLSNIYPVL